MTSKTVAMELIKHPERMDRHTVEVLKELIEQYPYYQTLHLLLLQNLYKLHDPSFSEQLKHSAVMVGDRAQLFDMVEGANYNIPRIQIDEEDPKHSGGDRMLSLIDNFLSSVPEHQKKPKPDEAADPAVDYLWYLQQLPDCDEQAEPIAPTALVSSAPKVETPASEEIEEFTVQSITEHLHQTQEDEDSPLPPEEPDDQTQKEQFNTETMAGIYIKQHKYDQALAIIKALRAENPKKSVYFADQIRYLELLIRINKNKK